MIARRRAWAESTSLNTIARAAAELPAPRVTLAVLSLTRRIANVLWAMIRDGACFRAAPPVTLAA